MSRSPKPSSGAYLALRQRTQKSKPSERPSPLKALGPLVLLAFASLVMWPPGFSVMRRLVVAGLGVVASVPPSLAYRTIDEAITDWKNQPQSTYPTEFTRGIIPKGIHSHNDYWRDVPLFSAIAVGAISVEADVWLWNDELYVGHDPSSLSPKRTFSSLYVSPLLSILKQQNPATSFPYTNNTRNGVFDTAPCRRHSLLLTDTTYNSRTQHLTYSPSMSSDKDAGATVPVMEKIDEVIHPLVPEDQKPIEVVTTKPKAKLSATTIIPIWIVLSSSVIMYNNYLYNTLNFKYPVFLVTFHLFFAVRHLAPFVSALNLTRRFQAVGTRVLQRMTNLLDGVKDVNMSRDVFVRAILPIGVLFSGSLIMSNKAYLYLSVSYIQMLKAFTPVAILLISFAFRIQDPNRRLVAIVCMISGGVSLASYGELKFDMFGFSIQALAVVFEASRLVMIQLLLHGMKMDPLVSLHYYAPVCAAINLLILPFTEGLEPFYHLAEIGPLILFSNAAVAFLLNVAAVFLIGVGSGLVLTLAGVFKDILLISGSVLLFGNEITPLQVFGYSIALGGLVAFKTTGYLSAALMADQQLPPGWISQWFVGDSYISGFIKTHYWLYRDETYQRPLFIQPATGNTQWEPPVADAEQNQPPVEQYQQAPPPTGHSKRRQYAAGQSQAYSGAADLPPVQPQAYGDPSAGPGPGPALFTPGLDQTHQPAYYAQDQGYGGQGAAPQAYGQPPPEQYGQQINQMANQFAQMGMGGHQSYGVHTTNLIGTYLDPQELLAPPPEIRLPPNAAISPSPLSNADPSYMRCTVGAIPTTNALLNKTKLPLALVLSPFRSVRESDNDAEVPVVADTVIARCRRCRTYINPYVQFIDGGNRWKCCMCSMSNDVPQMFDWDQANNQPADRWARYELNHSVVEFVAPSEYMVRPPAPPIYTFLIDVSHNAVQSGMVATAARAILESLDRIPNADGRTKVAIVGFDSSLHFFSVVPESTDITQLVVSDLEDVFLPKPTDLLINLTEARAGIESLLGRLNDMFQDSHAIGSALGPALQAAYKLIHVIGGKIVVMSSSLPTLGEGALKPREDPKLLGTARESTLLQPASAFYKSFSIDCSRANISVDMFLFSASYTDIASLSALPHYTSGQTYFYPAFNASRPEDAIKFAHEFGQVVGSPIGLEGLVRIRASRGMRMSQFHGNFFVRSTDLLAFPAIPLDQNYTVEVQIEENLTSPFVVMQAGILYTTSFGERRVRVVTLALPTTSNVSELYASADQVAIATYLANKAVERGISSKLEDARDAVTNKLVDILGTYKSMMTSAGSGASAQLAVAENLKFLPLLCLGLLKHVGLRQSSQIPPDLRAYAQLLLTTLPPQQLIPYIHPTFRSLHNMAPECGTVGDQGIILPPLLNLTSERFERHGLYLIEDGQNMFLWVGRDSVPQLVADVFDLPNYEALRGGKQTLPTLENDFSQRINAVIAKTRALRRGPYWPHLYVVKEDGEPALRMWALSMLIQDRMDQTPSYAQYISAIKDKVNGTSYG
ncbi:COPII subunit [Ceratobasidium sp. 423]|nr:COPII subunit [Ceratobasidium sp. 423]